MIKTFKIPKSKIGGPIDLFLTINSGQTSQPAWKFDQWFFQEMVMVDHKPCLVKIKYDKDNPEQAIEIVAESPYDVSEKNVKKVLGDIFGFKDDMNRFYDFLSDDPQLAPSIEFCKGLRLFKAHNPFECIISSISSANCSIIRWSRSINDIKRKWGETYHFNSKSFHYFPTPQVLGNVPEHDLQEMQRYEDDLPHNYVFDNNLQACGVGYRAKYIIKTSQIIQEELTLGKLARMNYEKAFDTVLELPGVGPKVADCILLYGFGMGEAFPVDVWIKRVIEYLYFQGKILKPQEVRTFGMEKFGDYAGYVQLYLFHYARKSGLFDLLRDKKKTN